MISRELIEIRRQESAVRTGHGCQSLAESEVWRVALISRFEAPTAPDYLIVCSNSKYINANPLTSETKFPIFRKHKRGMK